MRGQSLKQRIDSFQQKMALYSQDIEVVARYDFIKFSVLHIKSQSESLVAGLNSFPEVSTVEANLQEQAIEQNCVNSNPGDGLWGLIRISKRQESSSTTYSYQANDGAGGIVYVVDSGIRTTHNDFDGRAIHGFTAPDISDGDADLNGHGTHCAGTVMGKTYGVAKEATAIAVKVLDGQGIGSTSRTMAGLSFILNDFQSRDSNGLLPAVVSMSLRFTPSDAMDNALQDLFDVGCITTASAGNQATSSCLQSPARAEASIAVMASDVNNVLADFSSYGPCADIIAPGVTVRSTYINHDDSYYTMSGTSMACPHAAGVLLRHMTQMIAQNNRRPTPAQLRNWLLDNSTKDVINIRGRPDTNNYLLYAPCDLTT